MPLPVLEAPKYNLVVPSTKKKLQYRPFLVKEEKILMIAQESEDETQILNAIKEILVACTFGKFDPKENTSYDMEYIFLQLRSKSVGEKIQLSIPCSKCSTPNTVVVNLNDIEIKYPEVEVDNKIQLSDDVGLVLKPISMSEAIAVQKDTSLERSIQAVIDNVYDSESVYKLENFTKKEISEFIDSFSHSSLEKIEEYITSQPTLEYTIKFKCSECGEENEQVLTGLESFF
jgi:ribosomal protein L44E